MDWELYDLLGFGGLTPEIVEYITAYFDLCPEQFDAEKIVRLFKRLEHFYIRWCDGEFIDAPPENLPQKKMRLLKEQLSDREIPLGQRQVDVYAGLNILILLLELHRYAQDRYELNDQIIFSPSGKIAEGESHTFQLSKVIHYSDCLRSGTFSRTLLALFSPTPTSPAPIFIAPTSTMSTSPVLTSLMPPPTVPISIMPTLPALTSPALTSLVPTSSAPISPAPISLTPISLVRTSTARISTVPTSSVLTSPAPTFLAPILEMLISAMSTSKIFSGMIRQTGKVWEG